MFKERKLFLIIIAIATLVLVAVAVYFSISSEKNEAEEIEGVIKEEIPENRSFDKNNKKNDKSFPKPNIIFDYEDEENPNETDESEYVDYEDYDYSVLYEKSKEDDEDDNVKTKMASDFYDKKEFEKAKKVGEDFVRAYYVYDGDAPKKSINKAKKYMTDNLYNELIDNIEQPKYNLFYREIKNIDFDDVRIRDLDNLESIPIAFRIDGIYKNYEGKVSQEKTDLILLEVIKDDEKYKVKSFLFNVPY